MGFLPGEQNTTGNLKQTKMFSQCNRRKRRLKRQQKQIQAQISILGNCGCLLLLEILSWKPKTPPTSYFSPKGLWTACSFTSKASQRRPELLPESPTELSPRTRNRRDECGAFGMAEEELEFIKTLRLVQLFYGK